MMTPPTASSSDDPRMSAVLPSNIDALAHHAGMTVRAHRWVGTLVAGAGLALGGCVATTATAHADSGVGPLRQYWCPAQYVLPCDFWQTEFFQSPWMQSPLWQNPMVRVPWQPDRYG